MPYMPSRLSVVLACHAVETPFATVLGRKLTNCELAYVTLRDC